MTEASKRHYTVVFADVCRSTFLFNRFGDVKATQLIETALKIAQLAVGHHDGRVIGTIGDEILSLFKQPEHAMRAAMQIHHDITENPDLRQFNVRFRVGVHTGPVLVTSSNIHGDTVNTAARLADAAKANQSIASSTAVDEVEDTTGLQLRPLGAVTVRGKSGETEIFDILQAEDEEEVTEVRQLLSSQPVATKLTLTYQSKRYELDHMLVRFTLGRLKNSDILVEHPSVSRLHAEIRYVNGEFVVQDVSTNGSHILAGGEPQFVHRRPAVLKGSGTIFIGQTANVRHFGIGFKTFGG